MRIPFRRAAKWAPDMSAFGHSSYVSSPVAAAVARSPRLGRGARFGLGAGAVGAGYAIGRSSGVRGIQPGSSGAMGMPPASSSGGMTV